MRSANREPDHGLLKEYQKHRQLMYMERMTDLKAEHPIVACSAFYPSSDFAIELKPRMDV